MKRTSVILLLSLLLFPIVWNGISTIHYAVEHTHTFCESDLEHSHPNPDDCLSIFELTESQSQSELPTPTKSEFKELQQYLTPSLELNPILVFSFPQINFVTSFLPDDGFTEDVFLPPAFA